MIKCEKCKKEFSTYAVIDGKPKNLQNRKYCLDCSPWGRHNTSKLSIEEGNRYCSACKLEKPISEFHKKTKKYLHCYCKSCLYMFQKKRWLQKKKDAVNYLGGKCKKCGYKRNLSALVFHHKNPSEKEYDWNKLRLLTSEKVKKELDKCELLCSNCHAELHYPENSVN